ncbi:MAG: diguanylate cyclase domain-containing protein [Anaerovoracaceae bacterium]|jgi:diguanylate cyclase (GGDEF)-like protein
MNTLQHLEKFYENYPDIVIILNYDTKETVYLNEAARKQFGYTDKEYVGMYCYEVMRPINGLCAHCPRGSLKVDEFKELQYTDEQAEQYFLVKYTLFHVDDRTYQMSIASDFRQEWERQQALGEMIGNEALIDQALELAMNEKDPDKAINLLLSYVGEHMHSDRAYIFEEVGDNLFSNTYEWCREGVEPEIDALQNLPYEGLVEVWYNEFDKHRNILIHDLESYKNVSLPMYNILKPQNIRTLVVGPLILNHRRIGFYGVDNPPFESIENISMLYDVLGRFMVALIRHRNNEKRINRDPLTGAYNRNALDDYLASIDDKKSICCFFSDINELKLVNDEFGHEAGDELIQKVANVMMDYFKSDPVFRIGGDEFIAIQTGITEEEADSHEKDLAELFTKENIDIATGVVWEKDGTRPFSSTFHEADRRMYKKKSKMHANNRHPVEKKSAAWETRRKQ